MFAHPTTDIEKRNQSLNMLGNILFHAGIKCYFRACDGIIQDVEIAPEYAELARKLFARYQDDGKQAPRSIDLRLEQEWLRQRQK